MKNMKVLGALIFVLALGKFKGVSAQPIENKQFVRNYFRNPLGIPMKLSANFGELRPDHWHMGLDIRTNAKENEPVYAAAPGYIAFAGIRPQGFGRFIVINHPNGTSTLYAHLNDFYPPLEQYVTDQQYEKGSWAVELEFSKSQFPVSKGDFIGFSGNTGGSQGPHLHFEIFETSTQKRLNPLLFDFGVYDNMPPTLLRLAIYDRSKSIYAQTPLLYTLKETDSGYIIPKKSPIRTGLQKLSFAIQAHDRMDKGGSNNGIYSAMLYIDEEPVTGFILDSIPFEGRVYLNAHIDYRYDFKGGPYLQLLTSLPGNRSPVYKNINGDGLISLDDTLVHKVLIEVKDPHGNTSELKFFIQHDDSIDVFNSPSTPALVPNQINRIEKPEFKVQIPENGLYDTVPANYYRGTASSTFAVSTLHQLNDASYPVHGEMTVSIKANREIPSEWEDKLVMQRNSANTKVAKLKDGWMTSSFGDFGSFQVFADVSPPLINNPFDNQKSQGDTVDISAASRIVFTPSDNFGVIKNFRVELDSQWLRFTNDKGRNWIYKFDVRWSYGVHPLTATATDVAGNTTVRTWWLRREPYTPPPTKKTKRKSSSKKKK